MPSCNVTQGHNWVDPIKVDPDHSKILKRIKQYHAHSPRRFDTLERISYEFLATERPSKATNLVYTFAAKQYGDQSQKPAKDKDYFWEHIGAVFGNDPKYTRIGVGSFLYWQAAAWTGDIWLCCKQQTGGFDYEEEQDITRTVYWINNAFVHPDGLQPVDLSGKLNLKGLQGAWGAKVI